MGIITKDKLKLRPKIVDFDKTKNINLSSQDGFVLSLIDGKTTISDICKLSVTPQEETISLLEKLYETGAIQFDEIIVPIEKKESTTSNNTGKIDESNNDDNDMIKDINRMYRFIQNKNYYEILGISRKFSEKILKTNYKKLSRKYHPDRHYGKIDEETKKKLETIFSSLSEAYMTLSNEKTRAEYDKSLIGGKNTNKHETATTKTVSGDNVREKGKNFVKLGNEELSKLNYRSALNNYKIARSYLPDDLSLKDKIHKIEFIINIKNKVSRIKKDDMLLELDTIKELINELKIKLDLIPNDKHLIQDLIEIFISKTKNRDLPEKLAQKLINIEPENISHLFLMANIKIKAEKFEEALEVTEKILKIDRKNIKAKELYKKLKRTTKKSFFGGR